MNNGLSSSNSATKAPLALGLVKQLLTKQLLTKQSLAKQSKQSTSSFGSLIALLVVVGLVVSAQPAPAQEELPTLPASGAVDESAGESSATPVPEVLSPTAEPSSAQESEDGGVPVTVQQIPSLPPSSAPRYDQQLTLPNTIVSPSVLQPSFEDYHLGPGDSITHRSEDHTSELQSLTNLVCRLLLEKKKNKQKKKKKKHSIYSQASNPM